MMNIKELPTRSLVARYIGMLIVLAGTLALVVGCGQKKLETQNDACVEVEENVETADDYIAEEEEDEICNGLIFMTDYTVEDYCQGCFIVSKNDGLLYGLLDRNGNEILPVKYDDMDFLNGEDVRKGVMKNLYIKARYEDTYLVINCQGDKVIDKDVACIDYELGFGDDEAPYFVEKDEFNKKNYFYKEDGSLLFQFDWGEDTSYIDVKYFLPGRIMITMCETNLENQTVHVDYTGTIILDKYGHIVQQWDDAGFVDGFVEGNAYTFWIYVTGEGQYYCYKMDYSGALKEEGPQTLEEIKDSQVNNAIKNSAPSNEFWLGSKLETHLFQSNGTWKLEDKNGNPLYDERYYDCIEKYGCYFLMNEDNQMCLIDRNGNKLVDYEFLSWDGECGYFMGTPITYDNFFVGDDGVCFVLGNEVYFFGAE